MVPPLTSQNVTMTALFMMTALLTSGRSTLPTRSNDGYGAMVRQGPADAEIDAIDAASPTVLTAPPPVRTSPEGAFRAVPEESDRHSVGLP